MNLHNKKIYIAGTGGMVGGAIKRELERNKYRNLITRPSIELDLTDQSRTEDFFASEKPEIVILAAARVGGILANDTFRAEFIYNNLMIEANVIHAAFRHKIDKLIFLGSSCIYPRLAPQPIKEEYLLSGPLESTNEPYAIAKIAGIKLCENYYRQHGCNFISVMPTNLYGVDDNFDLETSHVIPALIRKFHEEKTVNSDAVEVWGSGKPRREFLFVDDVAEAVRFVMENVDAASVYGEGISHLNVGSGTDIEIGELATLIGKTVGFGGSIRFDTARPDGTPRKLLDTSRLTRMGWQFKTSLEDGLKKTYDWFLESQHKLDRK